MHKNIFTYLICFTLVFCGQNRGVAQNVNELLSDTELLNKYILEELNVLRKKKRAKPLENNPSLLEAAKDHALFLTTSRQLTHFQNRNKKKKTPDDRIQFYGGNFDVVGENIQQINVDDIFDEVARDATPTLIYQALAKILVENWRKSPPHYKNIIDKEFQFTYTAIAINENGRIFACQLFSGNY